ncbi:unnamed protein product [Periconia digitata]|uniref:Indole-diterpene biosynthesis protein-like protein PaxU n=1 Tax=Periconia digitata TaxID=1303443 RepID=A0A9W4UHG3_9PLEO|nr:unnamed protein product [Periconia digitata]
MATPTPQFDPIGHNTTLYTPATYTPQSPLILLFTWNAAALKHIQKYTNTYTTLFPTARILLIRCFTIDVFRSSATSARNLQPALDVVRAHAQQGGEVLCHSFSNGGGTQIVEFARAWRDAYGETMPMRAQIVDSAPGKGDWGRSHAAIAASLPRRSVALSVVFGVAVHVLLFCVLVVDTLRWKENSMVIMCGEMNCGTLFGRVAPRVYLYSKADEMVGWEEVEEHADEAAAKGWDVERVRFEKSAHAGHVREDADKYWGAVLRAWEKGGRVG